MNGTREGKVALASGGRAGIGRAAALAFAREGARVVVSDVNAEGGEKPSESIRTEGSAAIFNKADVSLEPRRARMYWKATHRSSRWLWVDSWFQNTASETPEASGAS